MANEITDTRRTYDCCVIGGGPTGLLSAVVLGMRGHSVLVLERQTRTEAIAPRGGPVRATTLQPATLGIFASLDLLDELTARSARLGGGEVIVNGEIVAAYEYRDIPGVPVPYALSTPLAVTSEVLRGRIDSLPAVDIAFGAEVLAVTRDDAGQFRLDAVLDGSPTTIEPRFVVAADGRFSATRAQAGIASETIDFPQTYFDLNLPLPAGWDDRIRIHLGAHGYLMVSPRAGDELILAWITDPGTAQRISDGPVGALTDLLAAAVPALAGCLRANVLDWADVRRVRHSAVRTDRWVEQNLVLLGDAAHGLHAFGGQGLNIALQDATCVAQAITASLHTGTSAPVRDFVALRKPYVDAFQDLQLGAVGPVGTAHRPDPNSLPEMLALVLGQEEIRGLLAEAAAELVTRTPAP